MPVSAGYHCVPVCRCHFALLFKPCRWAHVLTVRQGLCVGEPWSPAGSCRASEFLAPFTSPQEPARWQPDRDPWPSHISPNIHDQGFQIWNYLKIYEIIMCFPDKWNSVPFIIAFLAIWMYFSPHFLGWLSGCWYNRTACPSPSESGHSEPSVPGVWSAFLPVTPLNRVLDL